MNKNKSSNFIKLASKITLTLFILLQTTSQLHLHFDEHDHTDEHQCVICQISVNSFIPNISSISTLVGFGILLITFNYSPTLKTNNYKYSFTSRSPPLL